MAVKVGRKLAKLMFSAQPQIQDERDTEKDSLEDEQEWLDDSECLCLLNSPTEACRRLCEVCPSKMKSRKVVPVDPNSPKPAGHLRMVCISDTHSETRWLNVPDGDVLIHAGDFTYDGSLRELLKFVEFLKTLPHKHKVCALFSTYLYRLRYLYFQTYLELGSM